MISSGGAPLEIWASPEPTFARIGTSETRDQLRETGHEARASDIDRLAALGARAARYPVLWEKSAPRGSATADFTWARERLEALRGRGVDPIVTLLHHGSGPAYTSLVDPEFPEKFAEYARAAGAAFPWVRRWTPINEPLTTARFSTLYGVWYPNGRDDDVAFGHAIANEALAMLLGMEAIRESAPDAQFAITEDLQSVTVLDPSVEHIARHKRERSYLSIELVMGRVVPGHALYAYLTETCNVSSALLRRIAERASAPNLIGWNYYPNSERALDLHDDGTLRNRPARVALEAPISPRPLLRLAHERLGLPFGISEVHVNADAEGRTRWMMQRYADLAALAEDGLPVRMLGVWAAFGLVDWDSLLQQRLGYAEDGPYTFAGESGEPQWTAHASAVRDLAAGRVPAMPASPGWWELGLEPERTARAGAA